MPYHFASCRLNRPTVGRVTLKSTRRVLGHSLLRSLVRSHRSLIHLLRTARFARARRRAHSFTDSLTHALAHGKIDLFQRIECVNFIQFQSILRARVQGRGRTGERARARGYDYARARGRRSSTKLHADPQRVGRAVTQGVIEYKFW